MASSSSPAAIVKRLRKRPRDLLGAMLALVVGLPSLLYPYGRDQGLFHYEGMTLLRGGLPYRDAFDHKPPGIYAVYAAAIAALDDAQWSIRLAELLLVLSVGIGVSKLAGVGRRRVDGDRGAAILLTTGLYYTLFDYWDTAQVEIWEASSALAALLLLLHPRPSSTRYALAGFLFGLSVVFKLPAAALLLGALAVVAHRAPGARAPKGERGKKALDVGRALLPLAGGGALVVALFLVPYALGGALDDLWEVLIEFNLHYVAAKSEPHHPPLRFAFEHAPTITLSSTAILILGLHRARRALFGLQNLGAWLSIAFLVLALLSVAIQVKFYPYHYGVLTPFAAGLITWAIERVTKSGTGRLALSSSLVTLWLIAGPSWITNTDMTYGRHMARAARYAVGEMPRRRYLAAFRGSLGYEYYPQEVVGHWIAARARPGDTLCVRGFEPAIYQVAGLRCPSRFFAEYPLTDPQYSYERRAWRRMQRQMYEQDPPTFVVLPHATPRAFEHMKRRGYRHLGSVGRMVALTRQPESPHAPPPLRPPLGLPVRAAREHRHPD